MCPKLRKEKYSLSRLSSESFFEKGERTSDGLENL